MLVSPDMSKDFFSALSEAVGKKHTLLCVGLDPPINADRATKDIYSELRRYAERIVTATSPYTACYKPNIAFYEARGSEGIRALRDIIADMPDGVPVILDAKRGDIGNTAAAYAVSVFDYLGAHAVTLSPYLGRRSLLPFIERRDRGVFVLCRTSNPEAEWLQEQTVETEQGPTPLYARLAEEAVSWGPNVGLVVAGNLPEALSRIRARLPECWFLAPGIGAQGGTVSGALRAGLRKDGMGMLVSASRSIAQSEDPARAAQTLQQSINAERSRKTATGAGAVPPAGDEWTQKNRLVRDLVRCGCFKLGQFKLKDGRTSPFYIDLRMIISSPELLASVGAAYAGIMPHNSYHRIAGIPLAGVPIATALSLRLGKPAIIPRIQAKDHGSGKSIEGEFRRGERVVLVDDLITAGTAKMEAVRLLRSEGLIVEDLVVLIERGRSARADLLKQGIRLHAYLNISEFLDVCLDLKELTREQWREISSFLNNG